MGNRYNFEIIFEKLDEAKKYFEAENEFDYSIIANVDEDIRVLREYLIEDENITTFTRT